MPLQDVYVLTNAAMPGFVKAGKTTIENISQRFDQLYTTGVSFPFELVLAFKAPKTDEM